MESRSAHAAESLRQRRRKFDFQMREAERRLRLRMVMGWVSLPGLVAITVLSGWVLLRSPEFESGVVALAATALFVELLGLFAFIWRSAWRD
jgi:hypothetical protein